MQVLADISKSSIGVHHSKGPIPRFKEHNAAIPNYAEDVLDQPESNRWTLKQATP